MRLALGLALLASTALALPPRPGAAATPVTVAIGPDGGPVTVTCTNCSGGSGGGSSLVWIDGGRVGADVLSITGPDGGRTLDVSGSSVSVSNLPATQPVSIAVAPALVASSAVIGHVIVDTAPTTAVTLATAPALVASSAVIGHVIVDTAPTTAVTLATAPTTPVTGTFWPAVQPESQSTSRDGGTDWPVEAKITSITGPDGGRTLDVSGSHVVVDSAPVTHAIIDSSATVAVTLASAPTTAVTNAGLSNLDVALSTRTKPADQQHTIIDSSASIGVTGPLTDTQLRATAVPISGTVTATVTGATLGAGSAVIGHVITDTGSTTTITGNVAVTGTFWQGTQPVSVASLPAQVSQGVDLTGTAQTMLTSQQGVQFMSQVNNPPPLNPFFPRCNPVRRTGCQP